MNRQFLTVITAVYNDSEGLSKTAASISQYSDFIKQWIICDGTPFSIVHNTPDLSAPYILYNRKEDSGIYNAWNMSLGSISADWCLFLGAGDYFFSDSSFTELYNILGNVTNSVDFVCSNIIYPSSVANPYPVVVKRNKPTLLYRGCPPHSSLLTRTKLFKDGHRFDENLQIIADAEFMVNFPEDSFYYTNLTFVIMDKNGKSHKAIYWHRKVVEAIYILKKHKIMPSPLALLFFFLASIKNYPMMFFSLFSCKRC